MTESVDWMAPTHISLNIKLLTTPECCSYMYMYEQTYITLSTYMYTCMYMSISAQEYTLLCIILNFLLPFLGPRLTLLSIHVHEYMYM